MIGSRERFERSGAPRLVGVVLACLLAVACSFYFSPASAATAPNTTITNTTNAAYYDNGFGIWAYVNSNTLSTVVQNAPTMTVTAPSNQNVTQAMIVLDTFTLTNAGNAAGNFQVPSDAAFTGTATGTTLGGYVLNGAVGGTCSLYVPCTRSTLATQLSGLSATAISGTITVGVEYTASASVATAKTIITTLTANIVYPTAGSAASTTSANFTGAPTDTTVADARLDVQASATQPLSGGATITWTISANNGGSKPANDLVSAKTLFGASASGIALITQMPTFNSAVLGMTGTPTASACPATCTFYYSTASSAPTSSGNWSTTYNANATWLALYVSGGASGVELASAPGGSSGAGSVSTAQIQFSFTANVPSGSGSTTANAVTDIVNSVIGGQPGATNVTPVAAPSITTGTADATTLVLTGVETNATPSSGTTPPGGASNSAGSQAYAPGSGVSSSFVGIDSATQGNWHASANPWTPYVYGADGYSIIGGTTLAPSYATVTLGGSYTAASQFTASPGSDARAPYTSATSATRVSYHDVGSSLTSPFTIDVNVTDGNSHQFSLYLMEWDTSAVQDAILVTDVTHGTSILFHAFTGFNNGSNPIYVRWNISGHVKFTIYSPDTNTNKATFSAYFFDPVTRSAVTSSNAGSYVLSDTATQGTWTPGAGADGYLMPSNASAPSYQSSSTWYGGNTNTWAASTADVRGAYTTPVSGVRYAAQYDGASFGIGYVLTGGARTLDFYFLDWDTSARAQTAYVADATTGALFDTRSLSGFHNGTHVVWSVTGSVLFYFVNTAGTNAAFSGIYFGARTPNLTLSNAVSPTGNQAPGTVLTYTTTFTNNGATLMQNTVLTNPVPANADFQVGSAASTATGTGLTVTVTYSNNGGTSYTYTPVSSAGGAATGYDRNVTNVRWTLIGTLSQLSSSSALYTGSAPYTGNSGSVSMAVKVK